MESSSLVSVPPLFAHQQETVDRLAATPILFDASDPGTGKTRAHAEAFAARRARGDKPALVLAPKSILSVAWAADIKRFVHGATVSIATAENRAKAFAVPADFYVTNHDAVSWIAARKELRDKFSTLIVDESTAFKNPSSQRSKAVREISKWMEFKECMSGTPTPNSITELWHQIFLLDGGERLGKSYYAFRNAVCECKQNGPRIEHVKWVDKETAHDAVYDLIENITIRHKFEDCVSVPERTTTFYDVKLPKKLRSQYEALKRDRLLELKNSNVLTTHASALVSKLLQLSSGAVYTGEQYEVLDDQRVELVMDLIEAREQCLVAFLWKHQRDQLTAAAKARGFSFGVIDGDTNKLSERAATVDAYQRGDLRVIFAHPQSASHGLTLTQGTTTIWTSPTYNAEHFEQFNRRQYRAGQTRKTQVIMLRAEDTVEEQVYAALTDKQTRMDLLRTLLEAA